MDGERKKIWREARGHSETASNTHGAECFRLSENVSGLCGLVGRGPSIDAGEDVRRRLAERPSKPSSPAVLHTNAKSQWQVGRRARHLPLPPAGEAPPVSELELFVYRPPNRTSSSSGTALRDADLPGSTSLGGTCPPAS